MFRHLAIAALRNLSANRLQSAIAIFGLSIGIAAALLTALIVRNQTSYDHFIPGYERTYKLISETTLSGRASDFSDGMHAEAAALFKLNAPEIESVTRIMLPVSNTPNGDKTVELKRGEIKANEKIYWADPNVFQVLPLPVLWGDLENALHQPDGIVIPRATARKFFSRDNALGQTLLVNGQPMTVRAVIADLPANATSLESGIFASGLAAFSPIAQNQAPGGLPLSNFLTYLRLRPGADMAGLEKKIPALTEQLHRAGPLGGKGPDTKIWPVPLDRLPLFEGLHAGARARLAVSAIVGLLILFIAMVNFVNLLTARAARRALEVGIRKVCGAARVLLIGQFLGEAILTVLFATCLAVALSEWLLPGVNAFLGTGAAFEYWRSPLLLMLLLGVVALGIAAGAYPAFVLSSFRPAGVLKGVLQNAPSANLVRSGLVALQFSILIGLVVAASVIYQQHVYSTREGLRVNIDQTLVVQGFCTPAFRDELRKLPGVVDTSCSDVSFTGDGFIVGPLTFKGQRMMMNIVHADWNSFALYGIKPLAGAIPSTGATGTVGLLLNETAVKRLGFASPKAAIGQSVPMPGSIGGQNVRIAAVIPDISFTSVEKNAEPTAYQSNPFPNYSQTNIKLSGRQIPETLAAIDRVWTQTGPGTPINRYFLDDHLQKYYLSLLRQAQLLAIFSGVAVFLASLGLLGLSISTAERRTKEIGIRKAMGAGSGDVTRLLLWQFTKPVLWANLIAWPLAFYVMNNWLNGFAHHVALNPLVFVGATLLAVIVALLTVAIQSTLVARAVPATALRYE